MNPEDRNVEALPGHWPVSGEFQDALNIYAMLHLTDELEQTGRFMLAEYCPYVTAALRAEAYRTRLDLQVWFRRS